LNWKKLQGDVFRPPKYSSLLAILVGAGSQVFVMFFLCLAFLIFAFINIYMRVVLIWQAYIFSALASWVNGLVTARMMKFFGATNWKLMGTVTAVAYPSFMLMSFTAVDFIEEAERASSRVRFTSVVIFALVWVMLAVPLAFHGAYLGFTMQRLEAPSKVNSVKRGNLPLPFYLHLKFAMPLFGAIIFGSIFAEFRYILLSVWRSQIYAMFGYLVINMALLILIVSLISVIVTYLQLNRLNADWWWRSFLIGASGALYMGAYSIYYMIFSL